MRQCPPIIHKVASVLDVGCASLYLCRLPLPLLGIQTVSYSGPTQVISHTPHQSVHTVTRVTDQNARQIILGFLKTSHTHSLSCLTGLSAGPSQAPEIAGPSLSFLPVS